MTQQESAPAPSGDAYPPAEIAERVARVGVAKARRRATETLALSILGGAFIGLGADFSAVVLLGSSPTLGVARLASALAFSLGLVLVVAAGAELFTGNNLIAMAWASRLVTTKELLKSWGLVLLGNGLGAVATAILVSLSGQPRLAGGELARGLLAQAQAKVSLEWSEAFVRGILCNALVCLAVWLSFGARSLADKVLAVAFPVSAFVACGFEHSIANLFTLPLALLLQRAPVAGARDTSPVLTWQSCLFDNLLPVTLGNVVGGSILVAAVYWFIYLRASAAAK